MKCPFLSQLSGQFVRNHGTSLLRQFGEFCPQVQTLGMTSSLEAMQRYSSTSSTSGQVTSTPAIAPPIKSVILDEGVQLWRTSYMPTRWWINKDRNNDQKLYSLMTSKFRMVTIINCECKKQVG